MTETKLKDLKGRRVIDRRGREVGSIDDVTLDTDDWRVRAFVVELRKDVAEDLRMKHGLFSSPRLELSPGRIEAVGENVLLTLDTDELAGMLRSGNEPERLG